MVEAELNDPTRASCRPHCVRQLEPGAHPVARVGNEVVRWGLGDLLGKSPQVNQVGRLGAKEREQQDLRSQALE